MEDTMDIAVTGSRKGRPTTEQLNAFWRLFGRLGGSKLHHGDAPGVDRRVAADARQRYPTLEVIRHPANWRPDGPEGDIDYGAGPRRNTEMAVNCRAVIAFPGGLGTENCCKAFRRAGKHIHYVEDEVLRMRQSIDREHAGKDPGV
jgi:hypothetical protein